MKHKTNTSKIFWTTLILGLPILVGLGRLNPDVSALVETVNKPFKLVYLGEPHTRSDSLNHTLACQATPPTVEPSNTSNPRAIESNLRADSTLK